MKQCFINTSSRPYTKRANEEKPNLFNLFANGYKVCPINFQKQNDIIN